MSDLVLTTYDWVPPPPRGFVRDLRVRWALEEAGLAYRVESVPFEPRGPEHFARQPFGQVPWLVDGDVSIFESGAILLYLAERSAILMPRQPRERAEALQWTIAALNSMEPAVLAWIILQFAGDDFSSPGAQQILAFRDGRLKHLEAVLAERDWLAGTFSIADILMADGLRLLSDTGVLRALPACQSYVARAIERPAFKKAHADQITHFAAGDAARATTASA